MTPTSLDFLSTSFQESAIERLRVLDPLLLAGMTVQRKQVPELGTSSDLALCLREYPARTKDFKAVLAELRASGTPLIYDLDDDLFSLPVQHRDRKSLVFAPILIPMLSALPHFDLITVSTEPLKASLDGLNRNIKVLPNYFNDNVWKLRAPKTIDKSETVRVLYMGGPTHAQDLRSILPVLISTLEQYGHRIRLEFVGLEPPNELKGYSQVSWSNQLHVDYQDFADSFQTHHADIALAPLEDNKFNRSKSPIKFFEYSAIGAAGLFSNLEPYKHLISDGKEALLAASLEDWQTKLWRLIEEPALRRDLAETAQEAIRTRYLLSANAFRWPEAYDEIFRGRKSTGVNSLGMPQLENIAEQVTELNVAYQNDKQNLTRELADATMRAHELQNDAARMSQELSAIKGSKAWKFALALRNARVKLLPNNSLLFKVFRKIYRLIKPPARVPSVKRSSGGKDPLVSVVIPVYDRTDLLRKSIESILTQSLTDLELLLVSDGSPKATLAIMDEYAHKDPRVKVFKFNNNSGNAVRGRNKGIKEARGKYLAFHDSDDEAEPNRLQLSVDWMEHSAADVVYGGWRAIVDGTRQIELENGAEIMSPDCDLEMLKQVCVPCQSTVMARTEALRKVGGLNPTMRYREDHELWLRLAHQRYKFKAIPEVLTNLRLHQNNLEQQFKSEDEHWQTVMMREYRKPRTLKPKVGYVIPGTRISGGIAIVVEHANRLIERGYDVSLIAEDDKNSIDWFPKVLPQIIPISEAPGNYDILVATGWTTAYTVKEMQAGRKLYFIQSDETRFFEPGDPSIDKARRTYSFGFEAVTIASWIQKWLNEDFGVSSDLVRNGINPDIVHQVEPMVHKGSKLRVLLEGPIDIPFKGMADAFAAVQNLDCEVWCVSSAGEPKPGWHCDRFFYQVPLLKMKEIYSSCDVLLKMSRVEGCPLPPLEMMACGGTAVLGQVTGIEEYARDGENCLIVSQGDVEGARLALHRLMDDRRLLARLSANGKSTAARFNWEHSIDALEAIINREAPT